MAILHKRSFTPGYVPSTEIEAGEIFLQIADKKVYTKDNVGSVVEVANNIEPIRIAVLGDSLAAQNGALSTSWPAILETLINASGNIRVEVGNFAINGHTYFQAQNVDSFGLGVTALDACIAYEPDYVIDALGFNDTIMGVDARTVTQVQSDASNLYAALRNALPSVHIVSAGTQPYDYANSTVGTLVNRNVLPINFTLDTTGILANSYTSEIMWNAVDAGTQSVHGDWNTLSTHVNALADTASIIDYWKIARLGCVGSDSLHPTDTASVLQAAYVLQTLSSVISGLADQDYPVWSNPNTIFTSTLTWNGTDYNTTYTAGAEHLSRTFGTGLRLHPDTWYLPTKSTFFVLDEVVDANQPFSWFVSNAHPNTTVEASIDGGSFVSLGSSTDGSGMSQAISINPVGTTGLYTFRYKIGNEIHGPYSLDFTIAPYTVVEGGTGSTTASGARSNLGLGPAATADTTSSRTSSSTTTVLQAAGMNSHRTSGDHDGRYVQPNSLSGVSSLSLVNGWVPSTGYQTPGYYKDDQGCVHLVGCANGNAKVGDTLGTLPLGFRPTHTYGGVTPASGNPVPLLVEANGKVTIFTTGGDAFLTGHYFRTT